MNGFVIYRRKTYATTESNDGDIFSAYLFFLQEEGFISQVIFIQKSVFPISLPSYFKMYYFIAQNVNSIDSVF